MKELKEKAAALLAEIKSEQAAMAARGQRDEQSRLVAIAATDLEKSVWALEKAAQQ